MALIFQPIDSTAVAVILDFADRLPTRHLASEILQQYELRTLFCSPIILKQLVIKLEGIEQVKGLNSLIRRWTSLY